MFGPGQASSRVTIPPMPPAPRLPRDFFGRSTLTVAREILGQRLVRLERDGRRLSGRIVEAEAYVGTEDRGCHARAGRTARNETMWGAAGHAYVYFTYGMHWMLNLVTEAEGFPAAVLIRGILPEEEEKVADLARHMTFLPGDILLTGTPANQMIKLMDALDDHEDVKQVWSNFDIEEKEIEASLA